MGPQKDGFELRAASSPPFTHAGASSEASGDDPE